MKSAGYYASPPTPERVRLQVYPFFFGIFMHYYKRNLGDYAKKAGRLTMLQHGAYTLLIDSCYDREVFPTLEEALEWTWASTQQEIEAVEFVLKKFFTLQDGRYVQARIVEELQNYHANAETNKRIAMEREAKRRNKLTDGARSVDEPPPNHKPLTINQEPVTSSRVNARGTRLPTDWVLPEDYREYCLTKRPDLDPDLTAEMFKNFWTAKVGRDAAKLDWGAVWRNWVITQKTSGTPAKQSSKPNLMAGAI